MTSPEVAPCYGGVWQNKANGREVFIDAVHEAWVKYHYTEHLLPGRKSRSFIARRVLFEKRFRFSHIHA